MFHKIAEMLKHLTFLVNTQNHVDTEFLRELLGRQLGITSRNHHIGSRILAYELVYYLTALLLGLLCNGTAVYDTYIGLLASFGGTYTGLLQTTLYCCRLREVQFTPQGVVNRLLILKNSIVYHWSILKLTRK